MHRAGIWGPHTLFIFHTTATKALVEQSDAKSDIHAHALFLDLPSYSVLDKNVGRVST